MINAKGPTGPTTTTTSIRSFLSWHTGYGRPYIVRSGLQQLLSVYIYNMMGPMHSECTSLGNISPSA